LRIAITGSSGFVGRALTRAMQTDGADVIRMVRRPPRRPDEVQWCPDQAIDPDARLEGLDAVIHLAGAGIAEKRWTRSRRDLLRRSRVDATAALCQSLARLSHPPTVFAQASGVGIYGDRGDAWLDEDAAPGQGFLALLARDWERASSPLDGVPLRRVMLRIGTVLHPEGGALQRLVRPFRCGLGGRLGSGHQWMSWITRADLIEAIKFVIHTPAIHGPVNAVSPVPATNSAFTAALASACHRPALIPAPRWALRMALGGMSDHLLLASQRCRPTALTAAGFSYRSPDLVAALHEMLQRR